MGKNANNEGRMTPERADAIKAFVRQADMTKLTGVPIDKIEELARSLRYDIQYMCPRGNPAALSYKNLLGAYNKSTISDAAKSAKKSVEDATKNDKPQS